MSFLIFRYNKIGNWLVKITPSYILVITVIVLCTGFLFSCSSNPPKIDQKKKALAQKFLNEGVTFLNQGDYNKTIGSWRQAQNIFKLANHDLGEATCRGSISKVYLYIGQFDKAEREAALAIPVLEKYGRKKKMIKYMLVQAESLLRMRKLNESKKVFQEVITQAKKIKAQALEAQGLLGIAVNDKQFGRYYAAMSNLEKTKLAAQQSGWDGGIYNIYINYAEIHRELGNYYRCLEYIDLAGKQVKLIQKKKGLVDWEDVEIVKGATLRILGDLKNSRSILDNVLSSLNNKNIARSHRIIETLGGIGNICRDQNNFIEALNTYKKALKIAKDTNYKIAIDRLNGLIGDLYLHQKKYLEAEKYYIKAGNQRKHCHLLLKKGKTEKALNLIQSLIENEKKLGRIGTLFELYSLEMQSYEKLQQFESALLSSYKALNMFQLLRSRLEDPYRLTFASKATSPVTHFVNLCLKLNTNGESLLKDMQLGDNYLEMAFSVSEYLKGRLLLDTMANLFSGKGLQPPVPPDILKREQNLIDMENHLKKIINNPIELIQYPALREKYFKEKKMFTDDLYLKAPLYAMSRYPRPLNYHDLLLDPNEIVLSYFYNNDKLTLFLLRSKQPLKVFSININGTELTRLVNDYRSSVQLLSDSMTDFDREAARKLYQYLVKPIEPYLDEKSIITIIPDGLLNDLPFESFIISNKDPNDLFLIDRYNIRYFPSASIMTFTRKFRESAPPGIQLNVFAMADPIFSSNDPRFIGDNKTKNISIFKRPSQSLLHLTRRLPDDEDGDRQVAYEIPRLEATKTEIKEITKIVGDNKMLSYMDMNAQEAKIKNLSLSDFNVIHFATHGMISNELPGVPEPALVLSLVDTGIEDGYLTLSEVSRLKLNADVVILSACKTGLGEFVLGEGTKSLSWGFMQAGARSVVASLWSVDSETAKDCMIEFYRNISLNIDKTQALRNAKLKIKKNYPHPAYWAPFILQGE